MLIHFLQGSNAGQQCRVTSLHSYAMETYSSSPRVSRSQGGKVDLPVLGLAEGAAVPC